jgi:hypothetical protein
VSEDLINPDAIPIPQVNIQELRAAAAGLKADGADIDQAGQDITSTWAGLQGVYSAPEAETLFSVMNPVATKGDDAASALKTAAQALETFADTAQRIRGDLYAVRSRARTFLASIEGDEDWNSGRHAFDVVSEKGQEHDALLADVNRLLQEYQEAERECANAITVTFGGTTFIGSNSEGTTQPGAGEAVYGLDEPLENVATPWGTPQGTDHYWSVDAALAAWDVVRGGAEDLGGMVGAHGDQGWFSGDWGDNAEAYWGDALVGLGAMAGVYNPETNDWVNSVEEGFQVGLGARIEAVHGFFPWTELEGRPGYAWGTLGTNLALIGAGAALSATGAGAVVGIPLAASRVIRVLGGIGGGEGTHSGGVADRSGADGESQSNTGNGTSLGSGAHGTDSNSSEASDGISADDEIDASGIEKMNATVEALEDSQNQGASPAPSSADGSAPSPDHPPVSGSPSVADPAPSDRDESQDTDTQGGATQESPDATASEGTGASDRSSGEGSRLDPTTEEVDAAFAEIDRHNEDLSETMDAIAERHGAALHGEAPWTLDPLGDGGSSGRGDGTNSGDVESRVLVTPDGMEMRADGTVNNSADGSGSRLDESSEPVTVHEDGESQAADPTSGGPPSGGPPERPRPPGPDGFDHHGDDPDSGDQGRPSENPEISATTERNSDSGFPTRRDDSGNLDPNDPDLRIEEVRSRLGELGLNGDQIGEILRGLQENRSAEGRQVAHIIHSGRLNGADGFAEFLTKFGTTREGLFSNSAAELRFAYDLVQEGRSPTDIAFPPNTQTGNDDVDVTIRGESRADQFSYQIKDVASANGVRKRYFDVIEQLSGETAEGTKKIGIFEVNQSINDFPEATQQRMSAAARRRGVVFRLYFTDGAMTIPPGAQIYPE